MITWIVLGLILLAMFFAARYSLRKAKSGACAGCAGCGGCAGGCRGREGAPAPSHDGR